MKLRKDDPVYYKLKVNELILEAFKNGLKVQTKVYNDKISIMFKADNGDIAESVFHFD